MNENQKNKKNTEPHGGGPEGTYISAGDLEKYAYCPLSWWLSREHDVTTEELQKGVEAHREFGEKFDTVKEYRIEARGYERAVMWTAILATIVSIAGVTTFYSPAIELGYILSFLSLVWLLAASYFLYRAETVKTERGAEKIITIFSMVAVLLALFSVTFVLRLSLLTGFAFESLALMWLIGASIFLYKALRYTELSNTKFEEIGFTGTLEYHDSEKTRPPLMKSERYHLTGRPDLIIKKGEDMIPVEIKTGRIPRGPLFSHILQITAYNMLVEEKYGRQPPYGILRYVDSDGHFVEHEIEYTPELKDLVLEKIGEMMEKMKTGDVHRNHHRENKCLRCSRRHMCPERLA